jgi:hypothetical protein
MNMLSSKQNFVTRYEVFFLLVIEKIGGTGIVPFSCSSAAGGENKAD